MKAALIAALVLCVQISAAAEDAVVQLKKQADTVAVTIGGKDFTTFHFGKDLPKPFFSPVRAADGTVVTRDLEGAKDHPHHKGIWLSVDEVNEVKFWAEKGKIQNVSVELVQPEGDPAVLGVVNHWLGEDGQPILIERTEISIFGNRTVAYDAELIAARERVVFADTKEGLFGIRLADPLRESQGGQVVNADGLKTTKECWGQTSDWVDYYGTIEGKTYGVTVFDHPLNPKRSRYHVRDYGLFTISPFGDQAYTNGRLAADELVLPAGGTYRVRYAVYIHDGDTQAGRVPEAFVNYLKRS